MLNAALLGFIMVYFAFEPFVPDAQSWRLLLYLGGGSFCFELLGQLLPGAGRFWRGLWRPPVDFAQKTHSFGA